MHQPSDSAASRLVAQAHACVASVGVLPRPDLCIVHVRGDDRVSWLNGQITSDIRPLTDAGSVYALAVNVRGKVMSDLHVVRPGPDSLALVLPLHAKATVLESFERYIIMEDVVLEEALDTRVLSLHGPLAGEVLGALAPLSSGHFAADVLGRGGSLVLAARDQADACAAEAGRLAQSHGGELASREAYDLARLREGSPAFPLDFDDTCYPQEAGLHHAVSFQKGCYLGQEVVCTLEHRGRLSRHLCLLELVTTTQTTPATSADPQLALRTPLTTEDGQPTGELRSHAFDPQTSTTRAFGYVRRAHASVGTVVCSGQHRFRVTRVLGEAG